MNTIRLIIFFSLSGIFATTISGEPNITDFREHAREALRVSEALIPKLADVAERDSAWIALAEAWGELDPARGLDLFRNVKDTRQLEMAAIQLCRQNTRKRVAETGIANTLKTLNAIPFGSLRHLSWVALGEIWAESDSAKAAAWARSLSGDMDREWTLYSVARGTARASPELAQSLIKECKNPMFAEWLRRDIIFQLAKASPADAWAKLIECPESLRGPVAEEIGWNWAMKDRTKALETIRASSSALATAALCGIAAARAAQEPQPASVEFCALDPNFRYTTSATLLIESWSDKQPAAAMAWVRSCADLELRAIWTCVVLRHWASSDPTAARKHLETLPNQSDAWLACAEGFARNDSRQALAWAKLIVDNKNRCYALIGVGRGASTMQKDVNGR